MLSYQFIPKCYSGEHPVISLRKNQSKTKKYSEIDLLLKRNTNKYEK